MLKRIRAGVVHRTKSASAEKGGGTTGRADAPVPPSPPRFFRKLADRFRRQPPTTEEQLDRIAEILRRQRITARWPEKQRRSRRKAMLGRKVHRAQLMAAKRK